MKPASTLVIVLGAASLLSACRDEPDTKAPTVRPVLSVVVGTQSSRAMAFAGSIEPRYSSDHGFRVLGRIVSRDAGVGDAVRKGQRLATLDPVAYHLAVQSAEADLAIAAAHFKNTAAAEIRLRTLLDQNVAPQADFDAARQAREAAEAGVAQAKANLDKAKEQLGYTELHAEFDGVITAVQAEVGQVVEPGQAVMTVARPQIREAVIDLPEKIVGDLNVGAAFEVALQVNSSVRVSGTVREIAPKADASTRTLRVKIALDSPPESFRLGTTVTAVINVKASPGVELPTSALLERDGKTMIWVVDPVAMTVSTHDITIAEADGSAVRVVGGLQAGTRVVTAGTHSLSQGQAITLSEGALQ